MRRQMYALTIYYILIVSNFVQTNLNRFASLKIGQKYSCYIVEFAVIVSQIEFRWTHYHTEFQAVIKNVNKCSNLKYNIRLHCICSRTDVIFVSKKMYNKLLPGYDASFGSNYCTVLL